MGCVRPPPSCIDYGRAQSFLLVMAAMAIPAGRMFFEGGRGFLGSAHIIVGLGGFRGIYDYVNLEIFDLKRA